MARLGVLAQHRTPARAIPPAVAVLLLLVVAACGGETAPGAATPPPAASSPTNETPTQAAAAGSASDDAFAASMLVTRDDVPFDFLESQRQPDPRRNPVGGHCRPDRPAGVTGAAQSNEFVFDGQSPALSETVTVFASPAEAAASVEADALRIDCALAALNAGKLNEDDLEFADAQAAPVLLTAGVDALRAFQLQAAGTLTRHSNGKVTGQYTIVFASKGRVAYELLIRGSGGPMDLEELAELVANATARIREDP